MFAKSFMECPSRCVRKIEEEKDFAKFAHTSYNVDWSIVKLNGFGTVNVRD